MSSNPSISRRMTLALAGLIAVASATLVLAISGAHEGHAESGHSHGNAAVAATTTQKQAAFHDAMRKLWEDHITWTRLAIVSFAADLPDLPATEVPHGWRLPHLTADPARTTRPCLVARAGHGRVGFAS